MAVTSRKVMDADKAVALINSGDTVMSGGFGLVGYPELLLDALNRREIHDLHIISCDMGSPGIGLGALLTAGKIAKITGTFFNRNTDVAEAYNAGKIQIDLVPQGTFAEAIRAGGVGVPAFYTPTAAGTELSRGKEARVFDGREYILQTALRAKVALIRAHKADTLGNLVYYKVARNFNPQMAMAADLVIAEVDVVVPTGGLDPEAVITPHNFIDILVIRGQ